MRQYILKRVAHAVFIMWLVATTVFFGLATGATVGGGLMSMGRDLGTVFAAAAVPALVAALAMLAKSRLARPEPAVPAAVPAE